METIFNFSNEVILLIPIVVAMVEVLKLWISDDRYYPILAVLLGVLFLALVGTLTGIAWQAVIAQGVIIGLAASGLYSGPKSLLK